MEDFFGYNGKICVVTGAASGIGLATVNVLVKCGAIVYAMDKNEKEIEGVKEYIKVDLSSKESIDEAFSKVPEKIDSFFGVAGLSGALTNYYKTFTVNFIANKYITEEYLEKRMGEGTTISYVTSMGGTHWKKYNKEFIKYINAKSWDDMIALLHNQAKEDSVGLMAYPLSKRALNYYVDVKAVELGKRKIRVNALLPGSTDTGMKKEFEVEAGGKDALIKEAGLANRLATPLEMAEPLVFLNSNMARFVSGEHLIVDYGANSMVTLGLKKDRMDTKVAMKILNSSFVQNMLKKQLAPLTDKDKLGE